MGRLGFLDIQPDAYGTFYDHQDRLPLRRRINLLAFAIAVLVPWAIFTGLCAAISFSVYDTRPLCIWFLFSCCLLIAVLLGLRAYMLHRKRYELEAAQLDQKTWYIFLAATVLIATLGGLTFGLVNWQGNLSPHKQYASLSNYTDVDPTSSTGRQYLDAGAVEFKLGTHLEYDYGIGFKDWSVYCVAPIVYGDLPLASYDFWAVGVDCCNGHAGDFACGVKVDRLTESFGGLRLMNDQERVYYRVAIQMAEAQFGLRTTHPLFFTWTQEPMQQVSQLWWTGIWFFVASSVAFLALQLSCALLTLWLYTKK